MKKENKQLSNGQKWFFVFFALFILGVSVYATTIISDEEITSPSIAITNITAEKLFINATNLPDSPISFITNDNGSVRQDAFVLIDIQNVNYDGPILRINSVSTDSEGQIRIDALGPEIEFIETDQVSPKGKWELQANGGDFGVNSRNSADNGFEKFWYLDNSLADNGGMIINANTSSPSINLFTITNLLSSSGGRPGIAWRNDAGGLFNARMSAKSGSGNAQSEWFLQVANATKDLVDVLSADYEGKITIFENSTTTTCDGSNAGALYYDGTQNKHFGCNSTAWNALY